MRDTLHMTLGMTLKAWAPVFAALIAAFLGSWAGALAALLRFKRERAFDRQLGWYERMIRSLYHMGKSAGSAYRIGKTCERGAIVRVRGGGETERAD